MAINLGEIENKANVPGLEDVGRFSVAGVIAKILPFILAAAGIFLLVYLIMGGFAIMTSKGDPKAMEAARAKITYAIVGFVIIFAAFWITQILGLTTGIPQIQRMFQ